MSPGTPKNVAGAIGAAGKLVGRTKLQKTFCLLELAGEGFGFRFDYYKFGPYSEDLSLVVDRAIDLGYLNEEVTRAHWGGRYSTYRSAINCELSPRAKQFIECSAKEDAVVLELAVTAAFLSTQGSENAWLEVQERKPEKATQQNLSKARTFLGRFPEFENLATVR